MKSWRAIAAILVMGALGVALVSAGLDGGVRSLSALVLGSRALNWFDMRITVDRGMVLDVRDHGADHRLDVRAGVGGGRYGRLGEQLMTFGFKETDRAMVPAHEWRPCSDCQRFPDTLSNGLILECFQHEQPVRSRLYQVVGCRSVQHRLTVVYRCPLHLLTRCATLRRIRDSALKYLPRDDHEPSVRREVVTPGHHSGSERGPAYRASTRGDCPAINETACRQAAKRPSSTSLYLDRVWSGLAGSLSGSGGSCCTSKYKSVVIGYRSDCGGSQSQRGRPERD